MAVDFHGRETFLPSELLTDEDGVSNPHGSSVDQSSFSGFGSCGSSSSDLNTPMGSELDSTETESDDQDYIAELTRQMADYMLQEDDENATHNYVSNNSKSWDLSDCNSGYKYHHGQRLTGFQPNQAFSHDQIQPIQLRNQEYMKQRSSGCWGRREKTTESVLELEPEEQLLPHKKQHHHVQNKGRGACEYSNGGRVRPLGSLRPGPGMRAVFLKGSGSGNASCGTGVFLPRGTNNTPEPRKKPGCSTVLIPARVLLALQVHFNNMNTTSHSNGFSGYPNNHVVDVRGQNTQQKRQMQSPIRPAMNLQEMQLPQEWTY